MTNTVTFELNPGSEDKKTVIIEPDLLNAKGGEKVNNGVYRISIKGLEVKYIGDMAFHQEHDDWIYTGYELTDSEQGQIAHYILNYEGESTGEEPFSFQVLYNGAMVILEIIPNEGHFGVKYNGNLIASIESFEEWEQISGEIFDENVFQTIVDQIESHYEY